jgi:hypothetical protein
VFNNNYRNNCMREPIMDGCRGFHENIDNMPIAMSYVPWQHWHDVYDLDKALDAGTIFPELDLPFLGRCY